MSFALQSTVTVDKTLESELSGYLPKGDDLSKILSSPQFIQSLTLFWTAFISGHIAPVIQQFGLGPDVINAASKGDVESFLVSLERDWKKDTIVNEDVKIKSNEFSGTSKQLEFEKSKKDEDDDESDKIYKKS